MVFHDPQTAGLAPALKASGASVVLRSHVGADRPNALVRTAWDFLRPYTVEADAIVFTRRSSVPPWLGAARVAVIPPSIDPCATKNLTMEDATVRAILTCAGLAGERPGHAGDRRSVAATAPRAVLGAAAMYGERVGRRGSASIPSS